MHLLSSIQKAIGTVPQNLSRRLKLITSHVDSGEAFGRH
jgi:hypothetical protein